MAQHENGKDRSFSSNNFSDSKKHAERAALIQKARCLRISAETIAGGLRTGSFRSLYRGYGIEFSGVREYLRGDDVRTIDWNVTARMGKPFVKMFEEERELIVFLVVDCSCSMDTGSGAKSRLQAASEICELLTIASATNSSPVGAVLFDGEILFSCSPESGLNHEMLLLNRFESMHPGRTEGSALSNALTGAYCLLKKRSLVVVVSDFRTTGYAPSLSMLSQKHDVIAVRITDTSDSRLPEIGTITFADSESGMQRRIPTSSRQFARTWREMENSRAERFQTMCLKRGVIPLSISTDDDCAMILTRFFSARGRKC